MAKISSRDHKEIARFRTHFGSTIVVTDNGKSIRVLVKYFDTSTYRVWDRQVPYSQKDALIENFAENYETLSVRPTR